MADEAYVYQRSEPSLWTVGTYASGAWEPESDHPSPELAAARVAHLNGDMSATVVELLDELANAAAMAESEAAARHFDEHAQTLLAKAKRWRDLIAANRGGNRA